VARSKTFTQFNIANDPCNPRSEQNFGMGAIAFISLELVLIRSSSPYFDQLRSLSTPFVVLEHDATKHLVLMGGF